MNDKSRLRPSTPGFQCKETIEKIDSIPSVIFQCNLPSPHISTILHFQCREPSCGALEGEEEGAKLSEEDNAVDPNFFDEGYSMAGSTGFKVWTGSRLLIETLTWPQQSFDSERLRDVQAALSNGARVLELGGGVGVVGTYLAAVGAQVLITDLATLVENAIEENIVRNEQITALMSDSAIDENSPSWLEHGRKIGNGWADATPLDWTRPISEQLSEDQISSFDFIIASDVVFLASMLNPLLNTVESLFRSSPSNNPSFILSFQRRDAQDGEESVAFTTVNGVLAAVEKRGWVVDCLAWRPVAVKKEIDGIVTDDMSEVFVFEINNSPNKN